MAMETSFKFEEPLEMVEYPGKVINVKKMVHNLGGIRKISQTLGGDTKRMELHFHPDNPYNKAAYGDPCETNGILLSVKVRRSKCDPKKPPKYNVTILGYVDKKYSFDSLCDFQYLPLVVNESLTISHNNYSKPFDLKMIESSTVPRSADDLDYFNRTKSAPLISLPTTFVRFDTPNASVLRHGCFSEDGQTDVLGVVQKASHEGPNVVSFNLKDSFPDLPNSQVKKQMRIKFISDEQFNTVKKLFDECPIWTRIALQHESGVGYDKLKCLIPSLAYYFSTGPWRTLYVRLGYDPRKDYNSRQHQLFDFRLRYRSGISEFITDRKTNKQRTQNASSSNEQMNSSFMWSVDYPYLDEEKLPRSRQCLLRFSDIHIKEVQKMVADLPIPASGTVCDQRYGWLSAEFDNEVRQTVINTIKTLLKRFHNQNSDKIAQESNRNSGAADVEMEELNSEDDMSVYDSDSHVEELSEGDDD